MVCAKCAKLVTTTTLATPGVKKKNEMYFGSAASSSKSSDKKPSTLGQSGVVKSKLLSKNAKNPYAQYSSSCDKCKVKVAQGHKFCHNCSYKQDVCAMCGRPNKKAKSSAPTITGQKFTLK